MLVKKWNNMSTSFLRIAHVWYSRISVEYNNLNKLSNINLQRTYRAIDSVATGYNTFFILWLYITGSAASATLPFTITISTKAGDKFMDGNIGLRVQYNQIVRLADHKRLNIEAT